MDFDWWHMFKACMTHATKHVAGTSFLVWLTHEMLNERFITSVAVANRGSFSEC